MLTTERSWMAALEDQLVALSLVENLAAIENRSISETRENWLLDRTLLKHAAPFAWSKETTQAAFEASQSLPLDASINVWNLPGSAAWWHFDEPLPIQTVNHDPSGTIGDEPFKNAGIKAFAFGWLSMQAPVTRIPAGTPSWVLDKVLSGEAISVQRIIGVSTWIKDPLDRTRLSPSQTWWWHDGETLEQMLTRVRIEHQKVYGPGGIWQHKPQVGVDVFMSAAEKISRFILAGMAWLGQRVLVENDAPVERHRRKDFNRRTGQMLSTVRVVSLRRSERKEGVSEEEHRKLTVRFVVSGHWRNQACGPKMAERRLLYVNPYIKGPDNAPMQAPRPVVYQVNR